MPVELAPSHDPAKEESTGAAAATFISVVVPVRNEARFVLRTLGQLMAQDYDPQRVEIIVVDGESTDGTDVLVDRFAAAHENVCWLSNPRRLSSAARNIGVRHARGDVVVVVDGHCQLDDDRFLQKLAEAFAHEDVDCVGRPQPQDVAGAGAFARAVAAARESRLGHHPSSFIYASQPQFAPAVSIAVAYRRRVFETVGYFDERFDACEDLEFNHRVDRAGLRCYFTPEVAVRYHPRNSLGGLFRQLARYGQGRVRMVCKHPETFAVKTFLPGAFVAGCLVGPLASLASLTLAAIYLTVLAVYAVTVLATSVAIAYRHRNAALLPWLPAVFAAIHFGAGAGILYEAVAGRFRHSTNDRRVAAGT